MYILILIIMSFYTNLFTNEPEPTNFENVELVRVYDGDTIYVNIPNIHPFFGVNIPIRIWDIDTPEIRTKNTCEKEKAKLAKEYVEKILQNALTINLKNAVRGKYFRIVAQVWADDKNISEELINLKLAYKYDGGTKPKIDWCKY